MKKLERIVDEWGDFWCDANHVARLEKKYDQMKAVNAELVEALKALRDNVGNCICLVQSEPECKSCKAWEMAEAAIAKAEGAKP